MGSPDHHKHHYGRECLTNTLASLAMIAVATTVFSQMSWENFRANQYPDSTHAIVLPTPVPVTPTPEMPNFAPAQSMPTEETAPSNICSKYPTGLDHRDDACVGSDCNGWTFFGEKRGMFPDHVVFWRVERNG
ncbi:MAG: hypothetical protein NUV52_04420, partial [Candidatus Roizmanbacteria bacterium]|nr:hypothetical protein [Candidatus Roizmanbacteria bacterium]